MVFLWVNKRDWRHPGPIVNVAVRNAHSLARLGYETHLCLGAGPTLDGESGGDLRSFYGLEPLPRLHVWRVARWSTLPFGLPRLRGAGSSRPIYRRACRLAIELARRGPGPVVVLTREPGFLPYLTWLRWRLGRRVRTFYEAHDLYADLSWRARHGGPPVRARDLRQSGLERLLLPGLSGLVSITAAQRQEYGRLFPRLPGCALPLGTDPDKGADADADADKGADAVGDQGPGDAAAARHEQRRRQRRVVYVGRITRSKGTEFLLKGALRLAAAGVRTAFWGGTDQQAEKIRARAARRQITPWVESVPQRPPEELRRALATEASLGLVLLQDDFYNRYLTCPVKALDYLSHGLPTVASDLPSTREVLGSAGAASYLPPATDVDALVGAVLGLLDDPDRYARAAAAARRRARELSWSNRAARLVSFVESCG